MASMSDIFVKFEIEPIAKLDCMRVECTHNRITNCNLKAITLDRDGRCMEFAPKRQKDQHADT